MVVLIIISLSFLGGYLGARVYTHSPNNSLDTRNAKRVASQESELISSIASQVGPSVVSINVVGVNGLESAGTGFIISSDGYILTNRHVVPAGTSKVDVVLSDGTRLENVSVVGRTNEEDSLDVAFLKIADAKGKKLQPVKLGNSDDMQVGDMVVAIGNALGQFQNTVTSGIISGYGRNLEASSDGFNTESLQNLFQTDAAINQGNSGGPLVNADGRVIAINTAIATGDAQNLGFAIPINDALGLIKGVIAKGQLLRPYIGVHYVQLTPEIAKELGIAQTEGAYISEDTATSPGILPDSPAAAAGLRSKDIITEVNGTKVTTLRPLTSLVSRSSVGDKVKITFVRNGKTQTVELTLAATPN